LLIRIEVVVGMHAVDVIALDDVADDEPSRDRDRWLAPGPKPELRPIHAEEIAPHV